ncbi:MAG TPA: polyphosphate kinase [Anaeromyxobacter sp.]|nr:polyphosphate kinase [Anaeromyxobacter sp.]
MELPQELSWLQFNRRVLEQTRRADFPTLERLRFLAIWASNMDEFFAARIWRPFVQGRRTDEYRALVEEARAQIQRAEATYRSFLPELEGLGIKIVAARTLTRAERAYFGAFLAEEVAPRTDVLRVEALREVRSRALYFASGDGVLEHLLRVPDSVPRLIEIPGRDNTYVRLGELLRLRPDLFLAGRTAKVHELRVVRLAAIDQLHIDWDELPAALESRLEGQVSHLEVERDFPPHWAEAIRQAFGLEPEEVVRVMPPLDLRFLSRVVNHGPARHRFVPHAPYRTPGFEKDPFARIEKGDLLLYHPYQSYEAVEDFARAMASDPAVTAIRATLYRIGEDNVLAESLIHAARAGKDVAVLLEARARFDELTNLEWALRFQNSGVRVLRLPQKKVHAKVIYVRRGAKAYVHLGTGNYNTINGRLYTDISLFTADRRLTADAATFFAGLEAGRAPNPRLMRTGKRVRELLVARIRDEARPGGHVILKCNHLTDGTVLRALRDAAAAGARVDLLVRTTLTQVVPEVSARSLVGRFLEHARAAAFKRGGAWDVWAGSLDFMPRSFDRRYELFFPVLDPHARASVLAELRAQLADDVNAWELRPDGTQAPLWGGTRDAQRADEHLRELRATPVRNGRKVA